MSNRKDPGQDRNLFENRKREAIEILEHLVFTVNIFLSSVHHGNVKVVRGMSGKFALLHHAFILRVLTKKIVFLFLNQNICCGYSKEPSR